MGNKLNRVALLLVLWLLVFVVLILGHDTDGSIKSTGDGLDMDNLDEDDVFDRASDNSSLIFNGTNPFNETLLPSVEDWGSATPLSYTCNYGREHAQTLPKWTSSSFATSIYSQISGAIFTQAKNGMCFAQTVMTFQLPLPYIHRRVFYDSPAEFGEGLNSCRSSAGEMSVAKGLGNVINSIIAKQTGQACCLLW